MARPRAAAATAAEAAAAAAAATTAAAAAATTAAAAAAVRGTGSYCRNYRRVLRAISTSDRNRKA